MVLTDRIDSPSRNSNELMSDKFFDLEQQLAH